MHSGALECFGAQENKSTSRFSDVFMGDIQAHLSGVYNTLSYFKNYTLETCFTVELRLANAPHSAGNPGIDALHRGCLQTNS